MCINDSVITLHFSVLSDTDYSYRWHVKSQGWRILNRTLITRQCRLNRGQVCWYAFLNNLTASKKDSFIMQQTIHYNVPRLIFMNHRGTRCPEGVCEWQNGQNNGTHWPSVKIHLWRHSIVFALHYFQGMACYGSATLLEVLESWSLRNMFFSWDTDRWSCISEIHSTFHISQWKKNRWVVVA